MEVSRLDHLHELNSTNNLHRSQLIADRGTGRKQGGVNPWVVLCVLAIAGWFIDSMLVSIELHRLDGSDFRVHLTHFWYGPPILLALLLLLRAVLPKSALWVPRFTVGSIARFGRCGGAKRLADRLATRPGECMVLGVLLRYPNMAMIPHDLAGYAGLAQSEVEEVLVDLVGFGLVEKMQLVDTHFYRLTRQVHLCNELRELQEWDRARLCQTDRLSRAEV